MRAVDLPGTTLGEAMGKAAERLASRFVVLGTVLAILVASSPLPGEEPTGPSPFQEERPSLPADDPLALQSVPDQDPTVVADALPLSEVPAEAGPTGGQAAEPPIYPVLREHCRASRVYRSEILGRLWFRGEYLAWTTKGVDLPALVTGSPLLTDPDLAGVLPDASILFGDETIFDQMSHGARFTLGFWWDPQQLGGIEATYLGLPVNEVRHYSQGTGDAIVARPYFDVSTGQQDAALVAYPDVLDGSIDVRADMELQGAEVLLRRLAVCRPGLRVDLLGGYRFGRLVDRLTTYEEMTSLDASSGYEPDTTIERFDLFKSINDFHGGEAGLALCCTRGCWSVELLGKVGVGGTFTGIRIDGETIVTDDAGSSTERGGLLALRKKNIGYHIDSEVALMSELGLSLRCQVTCDLSVSVGYNLLHWTDLGRAADQIDLDTDPGLLPPIPGGSLVGQPPADLDVRRGDFWAQGLNVCLEQQF